MLRKGGLRWFLLKLPLLEVPKREMEEIVVVQPLPCRCPPATSVRYGGWNEVRVNGGQVSRTKSIRSSRPTLEGADLKLRKSRLRIYSSPAQLCAEIPCLLFSFFSDRSNAT